jgi:hypothetical protein
MLTGGKSSGLDYLAWWEYTFGKQGALESDAPSVHHPHLPLANASAGYEQVL